MSEDSKKFVVFYSWQTELPDAANRAFIRRALRAAASEVESRNPRWIIEIDEATRNTSGSPSIPETIQGKIRVADMFVGDITTVNAGTTVGRHSPNANVTFELGYAVAALGWARTVMLYNAKFGTFPNDVPFDFARQRISTYAADPTPTTAQAKDASTLLTAAIEAVLRANPAKPIDEKSPEEKRRLRDIENLRWILSTIHLPTIDQHILDVPYQVQDRVLHFWEGFTAVAQNSLFHLNDQALQNEFTAFHHAFHETTRHYEMYRTGPSGKSHFFSNDGDAPLRAKQREVWDQIVAASAEMRRSLNEILRRVRDGYVEIDISETNKAAWVEYVEFQKKMLES